MFSEDVKFGFEPSVIDGSEHIFGAASNPSMPIPKSYSFKRFLPGVLNQGSQSICVPCSVSAYLNWRENLKTGSKQDNKIDYHEIYNIRTNSGEGMTFKEAFKYLRHHGVSSNSGNLLIKEYAMIKDIDALKMALIMNGPCVGALPVYSDRPEFWNREGGDTFYGYHAISIVGYNSYGFIIRNSWGTSFGNGGYTTISFEEFNKLLEIWTILD